MTATPMWSPGTERIQRSRLTAFLSFLRARHGLECADYAALHQWSIDEPAAFWSAVWAFCGVSGDPGDVVLADVAMPHARWFPNARLNFAENLLRNPDERVALVFRSENGQGCRLTRNELYREVAVVQRALLAHGVRSGDRVAAYLPNIPATVVVMLACASIGAIFSSASPDFGVQGVVDRFGQIAPRVLFAVDGYWYGGKRIDCRPRLAELAARLPSVELLVVVPYGGCDPSALDTPGAVPWADFLAPHAGDEPVRFTQLPFDAPLYILYSSGTTGVPKCIVHGAGGALLQHLKEHQLHSDIHPGDRVFYFTTCGWMMWNWLVSALASEAVVLLFDGAPMAQGGQVLFDYLSDERATHLGTSAKFIDALNKAAFRPSPSHDLSALRVVLSTGSPLVPEGFDYVYEHIKRDVQLASISGGTDILSCFVLGNPNAPVWRGQIQCKGLGMAVAVFDEQGLPVHGQKGELVCTRPAPSMPIGFWNDPDGAKYRAAYFDRFPGVWCHGDFCEATPEGGFVIFGRSDATLNPGGVRIGTAEIYRQVEKLPEVQESLVIGQTWPPGAIGDVRVVLFVKLAAGVLLDEDLIQRIKRTIRDNTTPRHVPDKVLQVGDIPRTKSGKIVELAVRNVVNGDPVNNLEALANPQALDDFRNRPELMPERARVWDIFCKVVDNFGDIGVCVRLARQLHAEHAIHVRLWVDDLSVFAVLCPGVDVGAKCQWVDGVEVRHWVEPVTESPADVVIDAFGCGLPPGWASKLAGRARRPFWVTLEYLSTEPWANACHGLSGTLADWPMPRHFFFPGFARESGGLLQERGLLLDRNAFQGVPAAVAGFLSRWQVPSDALKVSMFCYDNPLLLALARLWREGAKPMALLAPAGAVAQRLADALGVPVPPPGGVASCGAVSLHVFSFLPQAEYDRMLWACDLNFVRGEDSFVRAQWAGRPFVWQAYPQAGEAQRDKVNGFLDLFCADMDATLVRSVRVMFEAWNGGGGGGSDAGWPDFVAALGALGKHTQAWSEKLATRPDLARSLVQFCAERI